MEMTRKVFSAIRGAAGFVLARKLGTLLGVAALTCAVSAEAAGGSGSVYELGSSSLRTVSRADGTGSYREAARGGPAIIGRISQANTGFGCQVGEWGIQDGVVKCAVGTSDLIPTLLNKVIYVRASLVNGFISGNVVRLTGDASDIRLDSLDNNGQVIKSCFLTVIGKDCDLGSPSSAYPTLGADPRYPYYSGSGATLGPASLLVSSNARFAGSLSGGGPLQDSYVVSAGLTSTGIRFNLAGVFYLTGQGGLMTPVYSLGEFTKAALSAAPSGTVFVMPTGWAAPF